MNKPIIGIVGRSFEVEGHSTIQLGEDYRTAVVEAGGIPLIIVPTNSLNYGKTDPRNAPRLTETERADFMKVLKLCDGFIMPGGTRWYDFDEILCTYALENDLPILGICMGLQILGNIDTFGKKERVIKTEKNKDNYHMQEDALYAHEVEILEGKLHDILLTDHLQVNSRHNYHILEKEFFHIEALAKDGQIEAISIPNKKFAIGVQWHPENMIKEDPRMLNLFKELIASCQTRETISSDRKKDENDLKRKW